MRAEYLRCINRLTDYSSKKIVPPTVKSVNLPSDREKTLPSVSSL